MNAELPRGIRTRRHHAALVRASTDGKGFAAQRRIALFFDGAEKSVQIEM
jgi:hypothetical protein